LTIRPAVFALAALTCTVAAADDYPNARFAKFERTGKANLTLEVTVKGETKTIPVLASPTAYKAFGPDGKEITKLQDRAAVMTEGLVADVKTAKQKDGTELVVEIRLRKGGPKTDKTDK
jgi:hypothetical protein